MSFLSANWPSGPKPPPPIICWYCRIAFTSSMFCAIASGATGTTLTSRPLTRSGRSIRPRSSMTSRILDTSGIMVSLIRRPKAEPKFCESSFMRSTISVAERALMFSGGSDSSSRMRLMLCTRSLMTSWLTLKSPERGRACSAGPCGPPLRATGMIAPGASLTVFGLSTPSSAAVYTPATASEAFLSSSSLVLFSVLMSGSAVISGPRP